MKTLFSARWVCLTIAVALLAGCGQTADSSPKAGTTTAADKVPAKAAVASASTGDNQPGTKAPDSSTATVDPVAADAADKSAAEKTSKAPTTEIAKAGATKEPDAAKESAVAERVAAKSTLDEPAVTAQAAEEPVTAPEPASATEITRIIDLKNLPRLQSTHAMDDRPTYVYYSAKATIAAADAFYQAELKSRGWEVVEDSIPTTAQYADNLFQKDGYTLRVTVGGEDGNVGVGVSNLGNIDVRALPRLADAETVAEPNAVGITYRTKQSIAEAAKLSRALLVAAGWQEYTEFGPELDSVPHYRGFSMRRNGLQLMVSISSNPRSPSDPITVSYLAREALPYEVPVAADGSKLRIEIYTGKVEYESAQAPEELAAWYQKVAVDLGWKVRTEGATVTDDSATLYLEDSSKQGFVMLVARADGISKVMLTRISFAEEPPAAPDVADVASNDVPPAESPDEPAASDTSEDPPSTDAKEDSIDKEVRKAKSRAKKQLQDLRDQLGDDVPQNALDQVDGFLKDLEGDESEDSDSNASDSNASDSNASDSNASDSNASDFDASDSEASETDDDADDDQDSMDDEDADDDDEDEDADDDEVAEDDADGDSEDPPAEAGPTMLTSAGTVDMDAVAKSGTMCVITFGKKKIVLKHAVAVPHKSGDQLTPAVLFSAKPISKTKLAKALASGENVTTFEVADHSEDSLEVQLSESFGFIQCSVEGGSISQGSDKIKTAFVLEGDRLRGQASLTGDEAFDKEFGFEATFDLKLEGGAAPGQTDTPPSGDLTRDASAEMLLPEGCTGTSQEGSPYLKTLTTKLDAPLDKVAEFYERETTADGWKLKGGGGAPDQRILAYTTDDGEVTVTLSQENESTAIQVAVANKKLAKEHGILPAEGKAKLVLANVSDVEVVFTINGKQHKLAAGAGGNDPADAVKVDVAPGKIKVTIKAKGGKAQTETVDVPANAAWGIIAIPDGGMFPNRLY